MEHAPQAAVGTAHMRPAVMQVITTELYPEETFPAKNFPHIKRDLMKLFTDIIKPQPELWEHYIDGNEPERILQAARDTLNFRNLLHHHPHAVVMLYQKYIEKFITFKHSHADERVDLIQETVTRMMANKILKIQEKFDFNFFADAEDAGGKNKKKISSFTSYFMVTVRNIYIDIIRERNVRPLTAGGVDAVDDVPDPYGESTMINRLLLKDELVKLKTILLLYYKSRAKLELCLKLKYRLPINPDDIRQCFPHCRRQDVETLTRDFTFTKDKGVFETILSVFNYHEDRANKSDTLRKWVNVKVDEITMHLNRTHGRRVYDSKNFADFIALYYRDIMDGAEDAAAGDVGLAKG